MGCHQVVELLDFRLEAVEEEELHLPHHHVVGEVDPRPHHHWGHCRLEAVEEEDLHPHHHLVVGLEDLHLRHPHFLLEEVDLYQDQVAHLLEDLHALVGQELVLVDLEVDYLCHYLEVD